MTLCPDPGTRAENARNALRRYGQKRARLQVLQERLREGTEGQRQVANMKSDELGEKLWLELIAKRATHLRMRIIGIEQEVKLIELALQDMAYVPWAVALLEEYYFRDRSAVEMCFKMGYSQRQFFRRLAAAVDLFAEEWMGGME